MADDGWKPDPTGRHEHRFWDGERWTEHVSDHGVAASDADLTPAPPLSSATPSAPPVPVTQSSSSGGVQMTAAVILTIAGVAGVLVGSVTPWATVATVFGSVSVNGTSGDGALTLVLGIVGGIFGFLSLGAGARKGFTTVVVIAAALTLAIAIYDLANVARVAEEESSDFAQASVGWGLVVCTAGATVLLVGALMRRAELNRVTDIPTTSDALDPLPPGTERGWLPDPSGRHPDRWWDGTAWTKWVRDIPGGTRSEDPPLRA